MKKENREICSVAMQYMKIRIYQRDDVLVFFLSLFRRNVGMKFVHTYTQFISIINRFLDLFLDIREKIIIIKKNDAFLAREKFSKIPQSMIIIIVRHLKWKVCRIIK